MTFTFDTDQNKQIFMFHCLSHTLFLYCTGKVFMPLHVRASSINLVESNRIISGLIDLNKICVIFKYINHPS